ncbi:hypothetical protein V6N13_066345 [Hibiscus sabdariffa]
MSSESEELSKKAAKNPAEQEKISRRAVALASSAAFVSVEEDPYSSNYGDVSLPELQSCSQTDAGNWSRAVSSMEWTCVGECLKEKEVLIRGRVHATRPVSKKMVLVVVRGKGFTVQCVVTTEGKGVSRQMVKFVAGLNRESIVDAIGVVSVPLPENPIKGTTQQVELHVRKLYCVSKAMPTLPINVEDASRSDAEIEAALQRGVQLPRVNQDTRLNFRVIDIRTRANQGIFRIQSQVGTIFRQFLLSENFYEIQTPKLTPGSSEGGSAVFKLDYKGHPACLAQSPQLHKQMAICGDKDRVFVIGPVFRAEDSYTHRHLCEFTGLDVEMEIKKHYSEVMDIVDRLFVTIFDVLNERCQKELEAIGSQYPFKPLKYKPKTLRLTFEEGVQMLKDAGVEVDPLGDLSTEAERKLGQLVLEKYDTEFYILHRYPMAARPFYTMPCYDNALYSNSFDVFVRGEEIISGGQRVHDLELLVERCQACGVDVNTISYYIDSFRFGAAPHGGFGAGLERVVMLFCALVLKSRKFVRITKRSSDLRYAPVCGRSYQCLKDNEVLIRGRVHATRPVSKKIVFVVVRGKGFTVQCVVTTEGEGVSRRMVKFVAGLNRESIVDAIGVVSVPDPENPIKGTTQQVELHVRKLYCVSKAMPTLPINVEDASRSEAALQRGVQLPRVNQDTRLNFRVIDIRTRANQGIFRIQSQVGTIFRQFLLSENFYEIQTPKLTPGSSEGGSAVFKLDYKGQPACLAQSPQLYKQMAICGHKNRVFVIGPVFRAEDSYTHRHLCEFTGFDVEMEIKKHYSEVMDIVDRLFVTIFDVLNERCQKELEAIGSQYPFKPLKYKPKTLRLTFEEGVQMLKDAGVEVDPLGDLSTEAERKLGQLVLEKYDTEFYILHRYPLAARPFYTMPCYVNARYSEEIISGVQRIHEPELLIERCQACGVDVNTISYYIDSFRFGAAPHGGFGAGLERVVMFFCALGNIRKASLFPRDPRRIVP